MFPTLRRRLFVLILGITCVAAVTGCGSGSAGWAYRDIGGEIKTISDYDHGIKVLCFSNTWCEPCKASLGALQQLQDKYGNHGVRVVLVSAWENGDPYKTMEEQGYTFGLMLNGTTIAREYDVHHLPTVCVVDPAGKVMARHAKFGPEDVGRVSASIEKGMRRFEGKLRIPVAEADTK